ncbi:SusC/RagA family TonB-linked outer membrane protein [Flavobacterium sp. HXWNR69]|uniref:SusC/RagA family TonB-linked outer membrane protein n=1 Tax=Flavobacterium fragile TaxID=2949085 RepID=A0ABT0TIH6_9FLAO|nr:SusC/RagA family TonB-linked outer membrane protein [Flavobacterium sp. HXWNR69]MCL9770753.1 SusC/RagA family TonB-linked outer membrane protein [Flavobacterium sp. HXWNR69]
MKSKIFGILALMLVLYGQIAFAQTRTVSGKVSDSNGEPLVGVAVLVKGTSSGTQTDFEGNYSIKASNSQILVFKFLGMKTQEITASSTTLNVKMTDDTKELSEVVVTALGIKREKKALGYATQQVKGDDVSDTPTSNFVESLSGEVAGLDISSSGTMGGSANIIVRGYSSLYGNNQALIVIDGTPVNNETYNSSDQRTGRGGYDYGNAASDINPDDIESLTVLKGAAATALYGSRASNGAIIITTKKGKKGTGIGVTFNSSLTIGTVDKKTLPKYQDKYGAGYGPYYDDPTGYFSYFDFSGDGNDDLVVPFTEDASYGAPFDPNLLVYQWTSIFPQLPGYRIATPWVAGANNPNSIFEKALTNTNSVSFGKSDDKNSFRLGFTNKKQTGVMPNSEILRNTLTFSGSTKLNEKLKASIDFTYTDNRAKGRNGTGYDSRNPMQAFRQWWQTNVDLKQQKDAFFNTGQNITWNVNSVDDLSPIYTDNVYWTLYKNYQNDKRSRFTGNTSLTYEVNKWFNVLGRFAFDSYSETREERIEVGSADPSRYYVNNRTVSEINYDLMGNFNFDITSDLNFDGLVGINLRVNKLNSLGISTNGGIVTPGLFTLANTLNPITPDNIAKVDYTKKVDGIFAKAGLGYKGTYYLDATIRRDRSSTLPKNNNSYVYPSISSSVIFSNLVDFDWLNFGKLRINYAEVGSDTDPYNVFNTYDINSGFGGNASGSNPSVFNNANLKPEKSKDIETGLEFQLFNNRLGLDLSYYNRKTVNLITPLDVSTATGSSNLWLNAGDIENKGIEMVLSGAPIKTDNFSWDIKVNYAQNRSEVTRLAEGTEFIRLANAQGGISLGAQLGEPFGVIRGSDYVYHENGQPIIYTSTDAPSPSWIGKYARTSTNDKVIGNINPDWTGGIKNIFRYKNVNLSFLIDVQKGGDVFSLDTWYGYATGLYDFTAGTNHLGNPVRNTIANGGGLLLPGVNADGTPNTTVGDASQYTNGWGYARTPNAAHVYDASFVKLRELTLGFNFPEKIYSKLNLNNLSLSLVGRNLWIIHKNTPYSDPEAGLSAGNVQGNQSGVYPAVKEIGFSLKFEF